MKRTDNMGETVVVGVFVQVNIWVRGEAERQLVDDLHLQHLRQVRGQRTVVDNLSQSRCTNELPQTHG